ncbi:a50bdc05-1ff5-45a5-a508-63c75f041384-CDS [Sclerotinia trifoliorum]|uniref:A50bdc05-1ff5-45a5-a508-63c75f041384-CDS n=1 Tax=Sclerotinia trifoliorum TaxID=28548 RepID=A0A8H2VMW0_9HELO|nr:a50bdc05-1ff5-45a5-a508-63c75f041384-CDS [Sclerotinia trifoliorum]
MKCTTNKERLPYPSHHVKSHIAYIIDHVQHLPIWIICRGCIANMTSHKSYFLHSNIFLEQLHCEHELIVAQILQRHHIVSNIYAVSQLSVSLVQAIALGDRNFCYNSVPKLPSSTCGGSFMNLKSVHHSHSTDEHTRPRDFSFGFQPETSINKHTSRNR